MIRPGFRLGDARSAKDGTIKDRISPANSLGARVESVCCGEKLMTKIGTAGRMRYRTDRRIPALLVCAALLGACTDKPTTGIIISPPEVAKTSAAVTGAAALALGPDGKFVLSTAQSGGQQSELNGVSATQLATAWIRQYAPMVQPFLEETHGSKVDTRSLKTCGRPLYARSAFVPPAEDVPAPYRRPYGPWWLVTYCDGTGTPTVSVAVSAWATDLSVVNGRIQFPAFAGSEFFPLGIPMGHVGEFPSSPEGAVVFAAQETGRRVTSVPDLVMPENTDGPPQAARWHMVLDQPVTLHASKSGDVQASETFVGPPQVTQAGIRQFVASPVQPVGAQITWSPGPNPRELETAYFARMKSEQHAVQVVRRVDTPTRFEATTATGGR